ncbi:hypothetical protein [Streptomyces sp. NPDC019224]|uniref:hypothetical protein n=1 Tax=Streptomyces sp. NPDC019224 TaxID=3154484 RepID=UPI0034030C8B
MAARNSEALDVLLKVAADPRVSWRTVELAGRGISADAAGVVWVLSEGKHSMSGEELSDLLMGQGDLIDYLTETWRSFESGHISSKDLEVQLERVVLGLEEWIPRDSG